MKQGPFEITLFNPKNSYDYEERIVDGKVHFVAVLDNEFKVRVKLDNSCGLYPSDGYVRVELVLDGVAASHVTLTRLNTPFTVTVFHGFRQPSGYRAFVFRGQSFTYDALEDDPDPKVMLV